MVARVSYVDYASFVRTVTEVCNNSDGKTYSIWTIFFFVQVYVFFPAQTLGVLVIYTSFMYIEGALENVSFFWYKV